MYRTEEKTDDDYMYRFRTNTCTKRRCRNPPKCFDAHSPYMRRRVPKLGEDGRFNYIPKSCPQWLHMNNKCSMGDKCRRSHGWLENIFHPLLFKTKMCKSHIKNGVCQKYGVYCAKAHNPTEIRNLVKLYGEDWKRHYDLSLSGKNNSSFNIDKSKRECFKTREGILPATSKTKSFDEWCENCILEERNSVAKPWSEQNHGRRKPKTSQKFTDSVAIVEPLWSPPCPSASPPLFAAYASIGNDIANLLLNSKVTSYIDLYGDNMIISDVNSDQNSSPRSLASEVQEYRNWCLPEKSVPFHVSTSPSSSYSNSIFVSPFQETWKIGDTSGLNVNWKMDDKQPEWDKERQPQSRQKNNSLYLFSRPNFEGNRNNFVY